MKTLIIELGALAVIFLGTIMLVGPLASPGTLAFKLAMRIYTGV